MRISRCQIENFTVFEKQDISFCEGVNVIIGANGTGKSHLLKILYSVIQSVPGRPEAGYDVSDVLRYYGALGGAFKPEDGEVDTMVRGEDRGIPAVLHLESNLGHHYAELKRDEHVGEAHCVVGRNEPAPWSPRRIEDAPGLFIPPNDVLSIYPGFIASYELRELAFDQTYYDICKALSAAPLKTKNAVLSRLKLELEDLLQGRVIHKGDHFYVQGNESDRRLEAHLLAEGHRKIAALVHLINNGSIDKDTVLFWDEPEANMNPRLIKHIATLLRELAKVGVQVFIATHDYLLTGELSLAAEYRTQPNVPIRFFAMSRDDDDPVQVQSGDTLADLQDNPILDEFADHYQREQDAVIEYMKAESST